MYVCWQSLGVNVQFDEGCVFLDGAPMDVNQDKCFIKARQDELHGKPLHRMYVQCVQQNSNFPDSFAWIKSVDLKSET